MRDIKTHVSHANAHQKVTPAKEFSNQVDGMLHFVDSQILVIVQLAHEQVITVAKMEVMRVLDKMGFHVPIRWVSYAAKDKMYKKQWPSLYPQYSTIHQVTSQ